MPWRMRRRKDRDTWLVDGEDAAGRRCRETFRTRDEAEEFLAERIKESREAAPVFENPNITVAEYAPRYLDQSAAEVEPRTLASTKQILRLHVLPVFGPLKVRDVHRQHVKTFVLAKAQAGLAKNTVRLIRAALSAMLSAAVDDGIIRANPALQLGRRRGRKRVDAVTTAERQRGIRAMSRAQRDELLKAAERRPIVYFVLVVLLLRAGLRPGEAYALEVEDIDFTARKIHIDKALSMGAVGPTKTGTRRSVDMSLELAGILRDFVVWRGKEKLRSGWAEMPATLFFNAEGRALDESKVRKQFARALKDAELSGFRLYDCRHTFASLLLNAGTPITYVATQLGHAKPTTTLQWYAHFLPSNDDHRFVDALDRVPQQRSDPSLAPNQAELIEEGEERSDALTSKEKTPQFPRGFPSGPRVTRTLDPLIKSQLL